MILRKTNKTKKPGALYAWHRYFGVLVSLVAIHLSITGILLNHSEDLSLNKISIHHPRILNWYGITYPNKLLGFQCDHDWISYWNDQIFFNEQQISTTMNPLIGALKINQFSIIATSNQLWLLSDKGEIIETLMAPIAAGELSKIGAVNNRLVILGSDGLYQADENFIEWEKIQRVKVNWAQTKPVPSSVRKSIFSNDHSISLERFLLDLHSGRISSRMGIVLVDIAGVIILFLAISGLCLWYRRQKRVMKKYRSPI